MPVETLIDLILLVHSFIAALIMEKWIKEEWKSLKSEEKYISIVFIMFFWVILVIYVVVRLLIDKIRGED